MDDDQYGISDLRHFISGRSLFPSPEILADHRCVVSQPYDILLFRSDCSQNNNNNNNNNNSSSSNNNNNNNNNSSGGNNIGGLGGGGTADMAVGGSCSAAVGGGGFDVVGVNSGGGDGGTGRWPRQETLTLLEIRSRLDPKFKEANQKGPLWDEISRIMCEEHGYQRSGKKCREKFENLYKYYKKTKEGKAGRQDGKHYRFFRQLEALYGGESNNNNNTSESHQFQFNFQQKLHGQKLLSETSLSLSNYSEPEYTTSSSEEQDPKNKKKKNWKAKIKDFIDARMKRLMERQDLWMDRMMRTMENNEKERMSREEEWRSQHIAMMEHEHELWDRERAWIRSRDATLMETLHRVASGKEVPPIIPDNHHAYRGGTTTTESPVDIWPEMEINKLIQLRTSMEMKFQQRGVVPEEALWEEISAKMRCCGHERSGFTCKHKWEAVNNYLLKCSKKRKEENNSKGSSTYFEPFSQPEEALEQSFISLSDHHHHHHHHQHHNGSR